MLFAVLENEMGQIRRHMQWITVLNTWAGLGLDGMMGTVIGLIGMLRNLGDKSAIGPNMAVVVTTVWLVDYKYVHGSFSAKLQLHNNRNDYQVIIGRVLSIDR